MAQNSNSVGCLDGDVPLLPLEGAVGNRRAGACPGEDRLHSSLGVGHSPCPSAVHSPSLGACRHDQSFTRGTEMSRSGLMIECINVQQLVWVIEMTITKADSFLDRLLAWQALQIRTIKMPDK